MQKHELGERLRHLDPGSTCTVEAEQLARIFGAETLTREVVETIEAFAMEHRCTFSYHEHGLTSPCFEKDDVF